jgi:molybdenum cofactor cytidylyltransferase
MICGLLLAAGGARRFKSQKLVAPYRGEPLVRHAARRLAESTDRLIVVVGCEAARVAAAIGEVPATVVENAEWERGLSTSIRRGISALPPECEAVVVGVGDQPGLDPAIVRQVVDRRRETGLSIVSARYRGVPGHPVLFARPVFAELARLDGDAGARLLIERSGDRAAYVDVEHAMPPDVDTVEQLQALDEPGHRRHT